MNKAKRRVGRDAPPVRAGRPRVLDSKSVASWRQENGASIAATAAHFGISAATVSRYCATERDARDAAIAEWRAGEVQRTLALSDEQDALVAKWRQRTAHHLEMLAEDGE